MASFRTLIVVPEGVDPFGRQRTVTSPTTGQSLSTARVIGPVAVTSLPGPPGPRGPAGGALPDVIDLGTPYDSNGA